MLVVTWLVAELEDALLLIARLAVAAEPGAGHVGADAIGPDQIGVEGDEVAVLDHAGAAFLEPWVGARAGRQDAGLDPLTAALDVFRMQHRPQIVLGDARPHGLLHLGNGDLAGRDRAAHGLDLVRPLDRAGMLGDFLAFLDLDAELHRRPAHRRPRSGRPPVGGCPPQCSRISGHRSRRRIPFALSSTLSPAVK